MRYNTIWKDDPRQWDMTAPVISHTYQMDADCLTILAAVRLAPDAVLRRRSLTL